MGVELLYNSVEFDGQWQTFGDGVIDEMWKGKPHQAKGAWGPDELRSKDSVEKTITQQSGPQGLRLSSPGERKRHNVDGHKSGGQNIAVMFDLQLPLTRKPWVTLFEPLQ